MAIVHANTLLITIALVGAMPCVVHAGDHYFECAIPGGKYEFNDNDGELRSGDKAVKYKKLREITIRRQEGTCTAKDGRKFNWDSHTYLVELAIDDGGHDAKLMFLCEQAGSGVPANESDSDCVNRTTLDKELRPAYRNRKK